METFFRVAGLCAGNSPVTGEFPAQRPVTHNFDVFFDLRLNKRLSKQSLGWTLSYYCDLTPSQEFQPMAAQLSIKATLPLAGILATASCCSSKTGPGVLRRHHAQYDAIAMNESCTAFGCLQKSGWDLTVISGSVDWCQWCYSVILNSDVFSTKPINMKYWFKERGCCSSENSNRYQGSFFYTSPGTRCANKLWWLHKDDRMRGCPTMPPAWKSNYLHYKACGEITNSFPNVNDCSLEVW